MDGYEAKQEQSTSHRFLLTPFEPSTQQHPSSHEQTNNYFNTPSTTTTNKDYIQSRTYPNHNNNQYLQPRGLFHHATVLKLDSVAGATGTSIPQLPGRHILVTPWAALVVWAACFLIIMSNVAGFILKFQARREFRALRLDQQTKLDIENEIGSTAVNPRQSKIARPQIDSFTRRSIVCLNSSTRTGKTQSSFNVSNRGEVIPKNVFETRARDSIVIADIGIGIEDQLQFSNQEPHQGFWDRTNRKSRLFQSTNSSQRSNQLAYQEPLPMLEMLQSNEDNPSESSSYRRTPIKRQTSKRTGLPSTPKLSSFNVDDNSYYQKCSQISPSKNSTSLPSSASTLETLIKIEEDDIAIPVLLSTGINQQQQQEQVNRSNSIGSYFSFNEDHQNSQIGFHDNKTSVFDTTLLSPISPGLKSVSPKSEQRTNNPLEYLSRSGSLSRERTTSVILGSENSSNAKQSPSTGFSSPEQPRTPRRTPSPVSPMKLEDALAYYTTGSLVSPSTASPPIQEPANVYNPTSRTSDQALDLSPDQALAQYASSRKQIPLIDSQIQRSGSIKSTHESDRMRKFTPSVGSIKPVRRLSNEPREESLSPDQALAQYALSRASTPSLLVAPSRSSLNKYLRRNSSQAVGSTEVGSRPNSPPPSAPMEISGPMTDSEFERRKKMMMNSEKETESNPHHSILSLKTNQLQHSIIIEENDRNKNDDDDEVGVIHTSSPVTLKTLPFSRSESLKRLEKNKKRTSSITKQINERNSIKKEEKKKMSGYISNSNNNNNQNVMKDEKNDKIEEEEKQVDDNDDHDITQVILNRSKSYQDDHYENHNSLIKKREIGHRSLTQEARLRRQGTTNVRTPLTGTMPSAGVRNSSFIAP